MNKPSRNSFVYQWCVRSALKKPGSSHDLAAFSHGTTIIFIISTFFGKIISFYNSVAYNLVKARLCKVTSKSGRILTN